MTDAQAVAIAIIATPVAIIAVVGMIRGYHARIWVYRPGKWEHDNEPTDHDDY